jgi:hypothetical protein
MAGLTSSLSVAGEYTPGAGQDETPLLTIYFFPNYAARESLRRPATLVVHTPREGEHGEHTAT